MGADYQHINSSTDHSLIHTFWVNSPSFGFHWHYHPEFEITCVKNGRGTRLVGDNVSPFSSGDFVFLGSNLPHTWISDDDFNQSDDNMEVAVLQFHPLLFPVELLKLSELKNIKQLLSNADRGIHINTSTQQEAIPLLYQLLEADGFERFSCLLNLLNYLGANSNFSHLASNAYIPPLNNVAEERILNVCRYVHENFMHPIRLDTIAKIANMNTTSFCRFFKKSTGQPFFEYVNDLRIGKACNLLLDKRNWSISEIAYKSGFNSQTLFNRIFLKKKDMTPRDFRNLGRY